LLHLLLLLGLLLQLLLLWGLRMHEGLKDTERKGLHGRGYV
jgi:hypothetical protein